MASQTLVLDNGAYTVKIGYNTASEPRTIPNCITKAKSERRRQFIGDQIDDCKDTSGLFYILPFQKGYLVNWDVEKQVWDYIFGRDVCDVNYNETCCVVTEPYFNFTSVQEAVTEILFEEYHFQSVLRINGGTLRAYRYQKLHPEELTCLLVESGYSFTYIVPYVKGKKLSSAIRRIDVGGKVLTNHLKDIISYRQLHVMDETYVINQVKEDVCFVSNNFYRDMETSRKKDKSNSIARDYVLPDYTVIKRGYVRPLEETTGKPKDHEQIIRMNNERFTVPELLFHPSDVGVQQCGIPEAIVDSIEACPEETHAHFYNNIYLTGGNVLFPGFSERLYNDLRALAPDVYDVSITLSDSPVTGCWKGGVELSKDESFKNLVVQRSEFEEHGFNYCLDKFDM